MDQRGGSDDGTVQEPTAGEVADPSATAPAARVRGLVVDYGGVLTVSLESSVRAWADRDAVDLADFGRLLREWLGNTAGDNPVHDLETGRMPPAQFERILADRLRGLTGGRVEAAGLLTRMFQHLTPEPGMLDVVRRARAQGIRTALLSNSWGNSYPREHWEDVFEVVVISGEVGMRKPDPDIYVHTAGLLGLQPSECVFVDDLPHNVAGAVAVGMVGVHHEDPRRTVGELEAVLGVSLSFDTP